MHQYPAYLQYAVKHGLVEEGSKQYQTGKKATDECMAILESGSASHVPVHVDICEQLLGKVSGMAEGVTSGKCLNMYDVRLWDSYPECGMNWPPPLHNITAYLRVRLESFSSVVCQSDIYIAQGGCRGATRGKQSRSLD